MLQEHRIKPLDDTKPRKHLSFLEMRFKVLLNWPTFYNKIIFNSICYNSQQNILSVTYAVQPVILPANMLQEHRIKQLDDTKPKKHFLFLEMRVYLLLHWQTCYNKI